ncbi:MAG: carboxy terminal-processing peptidase [Firmicutes bacterium]|nr:carboxy terminal-processing peptidase [Bacillota bacterium]
MKKSLFVKVTLIILVLALASGALLGKEVDKESILPRIILQHLLEGHYDPLAIDDQFSERVFSEFIKSLDYNKRFFLKADLQELEKYEHWIDNELKQGTHEFYDLAVSLLHKRVIEAQGLAGDLLKKPFDFSVNESMETDPQKQDFCAGDSELAERWRKFLKYKTLMRYLELSEEKSKASKKTSKSLPKEAPPFQPKLEAEARADVAGSIKRTLERMLNEKNDLHLERYLNAISNSFDPHTEYFSPATKEDFDINMTGTLEGIGASLREEGSYIKVEEIIPGSAAWRQNELKPADLILKVAQGDEEPVDVVDMPVTDVVKLIRGKKGTMVKLTVKKPDGRIVIIPIVRDIVIIEETYAKSAVITDQKPKGKYGYILLPSFYHNFNSPKARNAASDLRTELEKLKADKVAGVILDLRNNSGGALEDAVKAAGLFIKSGPVVQVKQGNGRVEVLDDPDSDIAYSGPVVVLVNSFSASAAEIVAAALQDYGRAVIAGSNTFGKGTVQTLIDLDGYLPRSLDDFKPLGTLKLTIQKFYRINGESTQGKGVSPDITLPDLYGYLDTGEKSLDYSLPWDAVKAASYVKWDAQKVNPAALKQQSMKRVQADPAFQMMDSYLQKARKQYENPLQSLKYTLVWQEQAALRADTEKLAGSQTVLANFNVSVPKADQTTLASRQAQKLKEWLKQISKDHSLAEAINIIKDLKPASK